MNPLFCRSPYIGLLETVKIFLAYWTSVLYFISAYMCPHYTFTLSPRYECGVPVIIEGETGVGKTALVEMLSKLWNQSLLFQWKRQKDRILDFMRRKLGDLTADESSDEYMVLTNLLTKKSLFLFCARVQLIHSVSIPLFLALFYLVKFLPNLKLNDSVVYTCTNNKPVDIIMCIPIDLQIRSVTTVFICLSS